jgi:hypothetical protein
MEKGELANVRLLTNKQNERCHIQTGVTSDMTVCVCVCLVSEWMSEWYTGAGVCRYNETTVRKTQDRFLRPRVVKVGKSKRKKWICGARLRVSARFSWVGKLRSFSELFVCCSWQWFPRCSSHCVMKKSNCFKNRPILYNSLGVKITVQQCCVKFRVTNRALS